MREMNSSPGIDVYGASYEREYGRWECEPGGHTASIRLTSLALSRYLQDDAFHFDLESKCEIEDDFLVQAVYSLAEDVQQGLPNGILYAEGLSMMIIGWLKKHYSTKKEKQFQKIGLSRGQMDRIRQFIDTYLDTDLSIERLAAEVCISPFHFIRLFHLSFGVTPHKYILQARVSRAAMLLRQRRDMTVTVIALAVGFSNQPHLTQVFKSQMGQTPKQWRMS